MEKHSIVIIEDHPLFRKALMSLLTLNGKFDVVGMFDSAEEALEKLPKLDVEVALIDVSLPNMNGIELVSELVKKFRNIHCVMLSGHMHPSYVQRAIAAGARGYILKDGVEDIAKGIQKVIDGEIYVSETLRNYL